MVLVKTDGNGRMIQSQVLQQDQSCYLLVIFHVLHNLSI
jgi:hypothetical protein